MNYLLHNDRVSCLESIKLWKQFVRGGEHAQIATPIFEDEKLNENVKIVVFLNFLAFYYN